MTDVIDCRQNEGRPMNDSMFLSLGRRRLLLGAGALLTGGVLAGCADEPVPPPAPPSGPTLAEPTPVAGEAQFEAYISEIHDAVVAADEARDPAALAPRITGSAVEFRTAVYGLIGKAEEWTDALTHPGAELIETMTSVGESFPRTLIAVVSDSGEDGVPYFMVLQQNDARSPYTTWGWAQQAAGVEMPQLPDQRKGSELVAADESGLVKTPAEALALYAEVLSNGDESDPDDVLAPNPFQTVAHERIQEEREQLNSGVERDEAATIKEIYKVKDGEFAGLRTEDGGAIVMGTLTSTRTVAVKAPATVNYQEENRYTKVAGKKSFTKELVRTYGSTVAMYIPPADSGAQIQPIGGSQYALSVSGS